jgi:hypothetical protein
MKEMNIKSIPYTRDTLDIELIEDQRWGITDDYHPCK